MFKGEGGQRNDLLRTSWVPIICQNEWDLSATNRTLTQILTQIRSYIFLRLRNFTIDRRRFHLSQEDNSEPNVRLEQKVSMPALVTVKLLENTFTDTDYGRKNDTALFSVWFMSGKSWWYRYFKHVEKCLKIGMSHPSDNSDLISPFVLCFIHVHANVWLRV